MNPLKTSTLTPGSEANLGQDNASTPGWEAEDAFEPKGVKGLQHEWKHVRLGDVAKTTSGGTPRRDRPQYYGGNIPWVKSGELGDSIVYETSETITEEAIESSNAKVFPKGTLCIALYGATVGKLGILGIDAATNQAVCAIFPPNGLDTRFLYRFFESKRTELVEQGKGGAQPNISQGIIRDTQIPLPPLPKQRRIVAEIEKQFTRLEAGVAALKRVQANLKRYRAAVLKAACEGKLVPTEAELWKAEGRRMKDETKHPEPDESISSCCVPPFTFESGEALLQRIVAERRKNWTGRGKYKEPAAPATASLPALPEGWAWANVGQLGEIKGGKRLPTGHDYSPTPTAFPYIRVVDFENYSVRQDDLKFLREDTQRQIQRYTISKNDIYISIAGSIGFVGVVPDNLDGANLTENAAKITSLSFVERKYICFWLSSNTGRSFVADKIIATTQPKLALFRIEVIPIPLPPLAEQTRIVAEVERRLSVVEELESVVTANLQRATRLRQSILQKAFTGELCA
jgi:type I restriction enzyme S subunit